ncbi:MAG: heme-binding protein [Pseudohongiellaceae bacterium]
MMKRLLTTLVMLYGLSIPAMGMAQESTPSTVLNYDMAQQAMTAALAEARANDWNLTIVVADHAGLPVMIHRMDGASPRSYDIALRKANVVTATGLSSGEYGERLQAGEIEEVENGVTFAGGVPVMRNGEMIGAITSSGARGIEDEQVSLAGAAAIAN